MKKKVVLSLACLALISAGTFALFASSRSDLVLSPDGSFVRATHPPTHMTPTPPEDPALKVIFSNLSTYRLATFFSIFGYGVFQNGSTFAFQSWYAVAFTPSTNATVTKIEIAGGRQGSGTAGFEIGLYDDAAGVPGKLIKSFHIAHPLTYGQCCVMTTVNDKAGIPVTGGQRYWVAMTTTAKDVNLYGWNFNTTNMQAQPAAQWCGNSPTICGSNNDKWVPSPYVQTAFAVLGN